jgi:DNA-binding IclR family transcriptional regulator
VSVAVAEAREKGAKIPDGVHSPRAKLVYLYLSTAERASVDELAEHLGMQKMALFSVLGTLHTDGHVDCDGDRYRLT